MKRFIIIGSIAAILIIAFLFFFWRFNGSSQAGIQALSPAQARQMFTGNWLQQDSMGSLILHSGGSFDRRIFNRKILQDGIPDGTAQWLYWGRWEVKDGLLSLSISNVATRNTTSVEPIGSVDSFRVSKVDASRLVLEKDGAKISFNR